MTDKITCPFCDHSIDVDLVDMAGMWRQRETLAARFGSAWNLANEYVDAFRVKPGARMALKKRLRHLEELVKLWDTGIFEYDGRRYRLGKDAIKAGMQKVCDAEKYGFKDHNYLKVVLRDAAERVSAEGLTAREEAAREAGFRKAAQHVETLEEERVSKEEHVRRIREIKGSIGRPNA
ncbi:hypothetical protein PITCH_A1970016 [uncultured Desulfobacterium sp.]|uniref:Uncharacterized protein n=1 Tax=uncultured Desulfobacterium sp. TaxID=201089 RepID=A0A445MWB4_9BACT|nr:hypothetical protein PITCH_A1970016 [uncultured Desulfobacterium sp.]